MIKTNIFLQYQGNKNILMYKIKNNIDIGIYTDKFIRKNFKEYKYIYDNKYSNNKMFCFNYALKTNKLLFVEDTIDCLFDYYKQIKLKDIKQKDIIALADDYSFLHFGIVDCIDKNKNIIIKSKLGKLGIYQYKLNDNPSCCGDRFIIFRRIRK